MSKRPHRLDISGMSFGKLTAIEKTGYGVDKDGKRYALWKCKCECGNEIIAKQHTLVSGGKKSCGCMRKRDYTKPIVNHSMSKTRIYRTYHAMLNRCMDEQEQHYPDYGGRGIKVCKEWTGVYGFLNFYKWSMQNGYTEDLTIDRIDVNGDYEPDNCRWTTIQVQSTNKRNNVRYDINGEMLLIKEISQKYNIPEPTLRGRMAKGMTMQEALVYEYHGKLTITYHGETKYLTEWSEITGINRGTLRDRLKAGFTEEDIFKPVLHGRNSHRKEK